MNQLIASNQLTMSSREIAELTGKQHKDVLFDCRKMFDALNLRSADFSADYKDAMNRTQSEYFLDQDLTMTLVMGYNIELRHRVAVRWRQLETKFSSGTLQLPDFTDPAEAAIAWATQYREKQALSLINKQQEVEINQLHTLFNEGMTPSQFAKKLNGVNCQKINEFLMDKNWLRSGKHDWRVTSYARDRYLTEKETQIIPEDKPSFIKYQPTLLRAGAVRLFSLYTKGKLPMKKSWDGLFTHDKSIEVAV